MILRSIDVCISKTVKLVGVEVSYYEKLRSSNPSNPKMIFFNQRKFGMEKLYMVLGLKQTSGVHFEKN